jgi:ribosomal protein L11 methyltransferase
MPWLALALQVNAAATEAFSDALLASGAESVTLDQVDGKLHAILHEGTDAGRLVDEAAAAAGLPRAPSFSLGRIEDADWVRASQAQFRPVEIGSRLWVGPSWREPPAARIAIRLDPGLAFGTGSHPTTKLVLKFLEKSIQGGERVLDYGCGSGILAIAAAKLGAGEVDAVDLDPQAVETTAANARANGVVVHAAAPESLAPGRYEIVLSNILAQPLIILAPLLAARAKPRARLALSGVLESQAPSVVRAYAAFFETKVSAVEDDWALIEGVRA